MSPPPEKETWQHTNPWNLRRCCFTWQRDSVDEIKLGVWDEVIIWDYPVATNIITRVFFFFFFKWELEVLETDRDWKMLRWWKKRILAKKCRWLLESGEDKGTDSSLEPPGRIRPPDILILVCKTHVKLLIYRIIR